MPTDYWSTEKVKLGFKSLARLYKNNIIICIQET